MAKSSNMVWRRLEAVEHLRSCLKVHGSAAAAGLEARMAAVLEEGEPMPDAGHLMDVLSRMLEQECRQLQDDDGERCSKTLSVQMAREQRRETAVELRGKLVDLRDRLRGIYGAAEAARILDLVGRTPRGFEELARYSRWLVGRLRDVELPPPEVGLEVDAAAWADDLEPPALRLTALVERLRLGGWRQADALHTRNLSLAAFDADHGPVTRLIESIYLLGGQRYLAKKLRPVRGRRLINRQAALGPEPKAGNPAIAKAAVFRALGPRLPAFFRRIPRWFGWRRNGQGSAKNAKPCRHGVGVTADSPSDPTEHPPRHR